MSAGLNLARIRAICFDIDGTLADTDDAMVLRLAGFRRRHPLAEQAAQTGGRLPAQCPSTPRVSPHLTYATRSPKHTRCSHAMRSLSACLGPRRQLLHFARRGLGRKLLQRSADLLAQGDALRLAPTKRPYTTTAQQAKAPIRIRGPGPPGRSLHRRRALGCIAVAPG